MTSFYMYNATFPELNLPVFASELKTLIITGGNITKIYGINHFANIECLNLSRNSLSRIDTDMKSLHNLRVLDLSHNNLTILPELATENLTLDISGNVRMQCHGIQDLMIYMKNYTLNFENKDTSLCLIGLFYWFNSTENVTLRQLEDLVKVGEPCREYHGIHRCRCNVARIDLVAGQGTSLTYGVDCSNQQLNSLPHPLPANTTVLNVSSNNISDITALSDDTYRGIRELYADHNRITSITVLEYSGFMNNFTKLNLRNNHLKSIPTHIFSNAFDRNVAVRAVWLGGNKLECDCNTAQVLKVWLMSNKKNVPDYDEVQCSNYPKKVVDLDLHEVCITHRVWTDYIYYIIAGEVALLIFLISKVSYDYWVFKTAGYLPWPASKLPKLPCDWVFET
ncbi:protein halfway isoform X2 [Anabrus simplex]